MARFLTLTLNPALDVFTAVDRIAPSHKLRCDAPVVHPGGGGINVARVLPRFGADVVALYPTGGPTGERLSQLVVAEGVKSLYLPIAGETRESFTVRARDSGEELRFVLPGPQLQPAEWEAALQRLRELPQAPRYLVASGSLPPGVPVVFYARLARLARERGSLLVLDSSGPPLAAALEEGVWLVKPSLRELGDLTGRSLDTHQARREAAQDLVTRGRAQAVALSLGDQGALLATPAGTWLAPALAVPVLSTIGAGDSFLAGLLWAHDTQADWAQALRTAMAAGAAALSAPGTALCRPADVERLRPQVEVPAQDPTPTQPPMQPA